jgi:magnesium chelatase accessory protein
MTGDPPADWPHRACSRRVLAGGLRWHVQVFERQAQPLAPGVMASASEAAADTASETSAETSAGTSAAAAALPASDMLLLHGAGASSHSWRDIAPALSRHGRVLVPDLPGHAFTARPTQDAGLSLRGMAAALASLLDELDARVAVVIGHSAGAAVAAQMVLDGALRPRAVVGLNGAWLSPAGQGRWFYGPLARLFSLNPWTPRFFAFHASQDGPLRRLLASTGSHLDARGVALYRRLVSDREHVAAVLAMMAAWDVEPLRRDLVCLPVPLELIVGEADGTVPPAASLDALRRAPDARLHRLPGLGHLAHEEAPHRVLDALETILRG